MDDHFRILALDHSLSTMLGIVPVLGPPNVHDAPVGGVNADHSVHGSDLEGEDKGMGILTW